MKRLLALVIALLCLTSCASMLEREVTYTAEHVENPPAPADAYRVNTYSGLYSALRSYVEEGMETGNLRFPATYPGNLAVDLEKAKRQLMEEDALGCYAVDDVTFHTDRIIAYYEVTAAFDYKVSPAEYMTLETVRDDNALDARMEAALEDLGGRFTVLLDRRGGTDTALEDSLERVYNARPDLALGRPALEAAYYPENSDRAVVEVALTYDESSTVLRLRRRNMLRAAETLADELADVPGETLRETLMARWQLDPKGSSAASAALLDGVANEEGLERGLALVRRYIEERQEEAP